jgi:hypothetical protein
MEFRQKEFRHLNFGNVEIVVEFRNMSKFYYNFDNVGEFPELSKFLWNYDRVFFLLEILLSIFHQNLDSVYDLHFCFIVDFPPEIRQYTSQLHSQYMLECGCLYFINNEQIIN